MQKIVLYTYLGTNGSITTPVHLEDIYYIKKYRLIADKDKNLTKNNQKFFKEVIVSEDELNEWREV